MDVNTTPFFRRSLKEDIYVSQAEGFKSKEHPDYICCLICLLYCLNQAPLAWKHTLNQQVPPGSAGLQIYTC